MNIFKVIAATPTHAWVILSVLLLIGVKSLKDRTVFIPRMLLIPVILSLTKVKLLLHSSSGFGFLFILSIISWSFFSYGGKPSGELVAGKMSVKLKGSYTTLVLLLTFFAVKYFFGYIKANNGELYTNIMAIDVMFSGAYAGYFLGRAAYFFQKYKARIKEKA